MAEEYQAGVCGGSWWINSSKTIFAASPCASSVHDFGSFMTWPHDQFMDMKATTRSSTDESAGSASDGSSSVVLQDVHRPHQILGNLGPSSSPTSSDWNQSSLLHGNERSESNYPSMLSQDLNSTLNYSQDSGVNCHQSNISTSFSSMNHENSSINQTLLSLNQQPLSSNSPSCDYSPSFLHTLLDSPNSQPHQQSLFANQSSMMNFPSLNTNFSEVSANSLPKLCPSSSSRPSMPKHHHQYNITSNDFPAFSNSSAFWNSSTQTAAINNIRPSFLPSIQPQLLSSSTNYMEKSKLPGIANKSINGENRDFCSMAKKSSNEPAVKRARIETPSPLPTFKVRKEKLGDRVTALQQLVSPFGKTDTASVLHEAIECIKFLQDQVNVLSTPYLKNGSSSQHQQLIGDNVKDQEKLRHDLRSRGLCLVPISSTFPVAAETTTEFWTPTFGGTFR